MFILAILGLQSINANYMEIWNAVVQSRIYSPNFPWLFQRAGWRRAHAPNQLSLPTHCACGGSNPSVGSLWGRTMLDTDIRQSSPKGCGKTGGTEWDKSQRENVVQKVSSIEQYHCITNMSWIDFGFLLVWYDTFFVDSIQWFVHHF